MVTVDPGMLLQQAYARIPAYWHKHTSIRGIEEGLIIMIEIWRNRRSHRKFSFHNLTGSSMIRVLTYIDNDFNSRQPRGSIVFSRYSYLIGYNKERF